MLLHYLCHYLCKVLEKEAVEPPNPVDSENTDEEPPAPISDAHLFIETRKRNPKREYKVPAEAVLKKIVSKNFNFG